MYKILTRCQETLHSFSVRKLAFLGGGLTAILLVGMYIIFFHRPAQRHNLTYVVEQINLAIASDNLDQLAPYVDFSTLGKRFTNELLQYQGQQVDEKAFRALEDQVQLLILEGFRDGHKIGAAGEGEKAGTEEGKGEEKAEAGAHGGKAEGEGKAEAGAHGGKAAEPASKSDNDKDIPPLFPVDALAQLRARPFRVQGVDGKVAILTAPLRHPAQGYTTALKLVMQDEDSGWVVVEVANAADLIAKHFAARKKRYDTYVQDFISENAQRSQLMKAHCYITDCRAFLARRDGGSDVSLIVNVEGLNLGAQKLLSSGMRCYLKNAAGKVLAVLPLNSVHKVDPSDPFQQNWQIELSDAFPETRVLLRENKLQCTTEVTSVSLGNGQIVFLHSDSKLEEIRKKHDPAYVATDK